MLQIIVYNLYGKAMQVTNNVAQTSLSFGYDAQGNRVSKLYRSKTDTSVSEQHEYYVRDASGNVLAVYNLDSRYKSNPLIPVYSTRKQVAQQCSSFTQSFNNYE